jgi:hypothetical protein
LPRDLLCRLLTKEGMRLPIPIVVMLGI